MFSAASRWICSLPCVSASTAYSPGSWRALALLSHAGQFFIRSSLLAVVRIGGWRSVTPPPRYPRPLLLLAGLPGVAALLAPTAVFIAITRLRAAALSGTCGMRPAFDQPFLASSLVPFAPAGTGKRNENDPEQNRRRTPGRHPPTRLRSALRVAPSPRSSTARAGTRAVTFLTRPAALPPALGHAWPSRARITRSP